jgi:hypothetical protein
MSEKVISKKDPIIDSARFGRLLVKIIAGIVAIGVWYIKISGEIFVEVIKNLSADVILQFAMIIYYVSWVFGVTNDIGEQEKVLIYEKRANTGFQFIGMLLVIAIVFSLMCLSQTYIQRVLLLFAFLVINFFVHKYYNKYIALPVINYSKKKYQDEKNYCMIEKTIMIEEYLTSPLLLNRLWVGVGILGVFTIILLTSIDRYFDQILQNYSKDFIYSSVLFVFIIAIEAIIWIKRIEVKYSIKTIDNINKNYRIETEESTITIT